MLLLLLLPLVAGSAARRSPQITAFRFIAALKKAKLAALAPGVQDAAPISPPSKSSRNPLTASGGTMDHECGAFLRANRLAAFADLFAERGVCTMGDLSEMCTSSTALEDLESVGLKRLQARTLIDLVAEEGRTQAATPTANAGGAGSVEKELSDLKMMQKAMEMAEKAQKDAEEAKAALAEAKKRQKAEAAAAAKEEKIRKKLEAAKQKAEDTEAKDTAEASWNLAMAKKRIGMRDVLLEGRMECAAGTGAFGKQKWSAKYGVFNTEAKQLDLYEEYGDLVSSFAVQEGSAANKGKAGPLGRRFRVESKMTPLQPGGGADPEGKPFWNSFLVWTPKDAQMWTAVFNGSEIREEDKKEEAEPEPEPEKPKPKPKPKYMEANPWKDKAVVDANIINTGVNAGGFSRFKSKPPPAHPKSPRARSKATEEEGEPKKNASQLDLADVFDKIDEDGNGKLTKEEVVGACDKLGITEEEAEALFERLDDDNSGEICRDEFAKFKVPDAWNSEAAVRKPKLTAAAANANARFHNPNPLKIKGSKALEQKDHVVKEFKAKDSSVSSRLLEKNQYKIKGAKVLEQKDHVVKEFKAKEAKVLKKGPTIPVAMNRNAAAGFATYKKGSRVYAQWEDGDWYPAMVMQVPGNNRIRKVQ